MTINVQKYKDALASGSGDSAHRSKILSTYHDLVEPIIVTFLPDLPVTVNTGADLIKKEKERWTEDFKELALQATKIMEGYNRSSGSTKDYHITALENNYQSLKQADDALHEIERVESGVGPGLGVGFPDTTGLSRGEKEILDYLRTRFDRLERLIKNTNPLIDPDTGKVRE